MSGSAVRREKRRAHAAKLAADKGTRGAINPHYLMAELGKVLDDEDMIFNEAVTNTGAVLMQIPRRLPNTAFNTNGAGLGWSGGMALGAKLAAPSRLMVQIAGDGSFYFNNPSSVFAVAQQYGLPILSVVLDNSGWGAVKASTLRVFPEGEAQYRQGIRIGACREGRVRQGRRSVRRLRREGRRSRRRAGGDCALRQDGARRPFGAAARASDALIGRPGCSFRRKAAIQIEIAERDIASPRARGRAVRFAVRRDNRRRRSCPSVRPHCRSR